MMLKKVALTEQTNYLFLHYIGTNALPDTMDLFHTHDDYEIIYLVDGTAFYCVDNYSFTAKSGDFIFINSKQSHSIIVPENSVFERKVLMIKPNLSFYFMLNIDIFGIFDLIAKEYNYLPVLTEDQKTILLKHFDVFLTLMKDNSNEGQIKFYCAIVQFLVDCSKIFRQATCNNNVNNNLCNSVINYINANISKELSLDLLTKEFYTSKYYLCHIFKEHTGWSIQNYISNKRIFLARNLILSGNSALTVSQDVGYLNYSNFYKSFKHIVGCAPSKLKSQK